MSKNRTMAIKNAKVIKYSISSSKDLLAADAWNECARSKKKADGLKLYSQHAEYMQIRDALTSKPRQKWETKKAIDLVCNA